MPVPLILTGGLLAAAVLAAGEGPGADPTDRPREHAEVIKSSAHEYVIRMGGTMDGPSTRSPIAIKSCQAFM